MKGKPSSGGRPKVGVADMWIRSEETSGSAGVTGGLTLRMRHNYLLTSFSRARIQWYYDP